MGEKDDFGSLFEEIQSIIGGKSVCKSGLQLGSGCLLTSREVTKQRWNRKWDKALNLRTQPSETNFVRQSPTSQSICKSP